MFDQFYGHFYGLFGGLICDCLWYVKGLFGLCLAGFMIVFIACLWMVLWAGFFLLLWHVQIIVLGIVWVKNMDYLGACLG